MSKKAHITLSILYLGCALIGIVHPFLSDISNTGIALPVFFILPALLIIKFVVHQFFVDKSSLYVLNAAIVSWSTLGILYNIFFIKWALTEMLFLTSLVFAFIIIMEVRYLDRIFMAASATIITMLGIYTVVNVEDYSISFRHPSGTIMSVGIYLIYILLISYINEMRLYRQAPKLADVNEELGMDTFLKVLSQHLKIPVNDLVAISGDESETTLSKDSIRFSTNSLLNLHSSINTLLSISKGESTNVRALINRIDTPINTIISLEGAEDKVFEHLDFISHYVVLENFFASCSKNRIRAEIGYSNEILSIQIKLLSAHSVNCELIAESAQRNLGLCGWEVHKLKEDKATVGIDARLNLRDR